MTSRYPGKRRRHYERVYKALGRAELQRGAPALDELDLAGLFDNQDGLIFDYYTHEGLNFGLNEYGLYNDLRRIGYEELELKTKPDEQGEHLIRIKSALPACEEPLVELVASRRKLTLRDELRQQLDDHTFSVLSVEWLQLQHPLGMFSEDKPILPGQSLPGLGMARQIFELLRNVCRRLKLDALVTTPSYFHNAVFYQIGFSYLDPMYQARLIAMKRDFHELFEAHLPNAPDHAQLATSSWALQWGHVMECDEMSTHRADWFHEPMVSPVSQELKRYMRSSWYEREVLNRAEQLHYQWLTHALETQLEEAGIIPHDMARQQALSTEENA